MSRIWLLKTEIDLGYGTVSEYVIRAETERAARKIAHEDAIEMDANYERNRHMPDGWNNPALSTCIEVTKDGKAGIISACYQD